MGLNKLGNCQTVINSKLLKLWDFPQLMQRRTGRVFTKHYVNMTLIIDPNYLSLFSYLVYQSAADNTFIYSSFLLEQYKQTVKAAADKYQVCNPYLTTSLPNARKHMIWLIQNGFVLPCTRKYQYLINPNLTYSRLYVLPRFYLNFVKCYGMIVNSADENAVKSLCNSYIDHVRHELNRKNK
jgi:hypothetical protein